MSSICGIFSRRGSPLPRELIGAMTDVLGHWRVAGDPAGTWQNDSGTIALGQVMLANTPESLGERLPFHLAAAGLAITADARLDNRDELGRQLGVPPLELVTHPDSQLILRAYLEWGRECAARLIGDFAFAIWYAREDRLLCARDQIGAKPLFYTLTGNLFGCATELKGIFRVTGRPRDLDPAWIANALREKLARTRAWRLLRQEYQQAKASGNKIPLGSLLSRLASGISPNPQCR